MPFCNVVGHGALLHLIARAVGRQTLPPSLLFVGPDGVGKQRVAMALAQVQNCLVPVETTTFDVDACGSCEACLKIARGSFADVLRLEPGEAGSITIDQVRQVVRQAAYRPFEGRRRVVVVMDADGLLVAAQNALLKTLEEPPDSSQFILVTSRPDVLLPTVRSRMQRLTFGQLTTEEVEAVLVHEGIDERAARAGAATAGGSAGQALALASGEFVEARDAAVALLRDIATSRDARQRLEAAKQLAGKGRGGGVARQALDAASPRVDVTNTRCRARGGRIRCRHSRQRRCCGPDRASVTELWRSTRSRRVRRRRSCTRCRRTQRQPEGRG